MVPYCISFDLVSGDNLCKNDAFFCLGYDLVFICRAYHQGDTYRCLFTAQNKTVLELYISSVQHLFHLQPFPGSETTTLKTALQSPLSPIFQTTFSDSFAHTIHSITESESSTISHLETPMSAQRIHLSQRVYIASQNFQEGTSSATVTSKH